MSRTPHSRQPKQDPEHPPEHPPEHHPEHPRQTPGPETLEIFQEGFGERLPEVLQVASWNRDGDIDRDMERIEREVREAVAVETRAQHELRERFHDLLASADGAPRGAGVYRVSPEEIREVHRGLLFNGAVEACDGFTQKHDTLALTMHHIGVSLVSYGGAAGSWQTRLFRRDLRRTHPDPTEALLELLARRRRRPGLHDEAEDALSGLAERGLMVYAERAILTRAAKAPWRMGHGSPAPLEMIVAYFTDLVIESIRVIREMVAHQRFVFVASEPDDRLLLTVGHSLKPLEYAIVGTLSESITRYLDRWTLRHPATVDLEWDAQTGQLDPREWLVRFRDEIASQVVYGVYRATPLAPPQQFFAHIDRTRTAAAIAIADSIFQEQRGFPQLIDIADRMCRGIRGDGAFQEMADAAYARIGEPFRYGSERDTRE